MAAHTIPASTLHALEFDRVVQVVQGMALTPLGAASVRELRPSTDRDDVRAALAVTTECVEYLTANGQIGLYAPEDLADTVATLAVHGQPLEPDQLLGLADYLASVARVRAAIVGARGGSFPAMTEIATRCRSFEEEVASIRRAIDATGVVVDDASPELRRIRERLRRQRTRLRGTLDSYLRGRDTAKYLQEQVVTERNGRFVLVVRSEHRGAIPGIVHGSSGSGASLFLEPLSTVDINNEIVALEQEEHKEIWRILLSLSDAFRSRALDVRQTLEAATEIDAVYARASFSRLVRGNAPELSDEPALEWKEARHPLLIHAVRARLGAGPSETDARPVPVDVSLVPPTTALVISGPNTGGKTVALKTAGLLSLMAQAGLHVPAAEGSRTPVFQSIFADIGDEQSIAASLSTFSGHIANLVAIERELRSPALVLLDELGGGTDPTEGGALAAAVTDHFRRRGAMVVVTTHDDTLKSYAATTTGVSCAGFGFDPETYAPTYRLNYGSPGRSLAFEIASRLGLPSEVIEDARTRRSERETRLADHLAKVEQDLQRLEHDRQALAGERDRLDAERRQFVVAQRAGEEREAKAKERLVAGVDHHVRAARREIDDVVRALRSRVAAIEQAAISRAKTGRAGLSTGEAGSLRSESHSAVDRVMAQVLDRTKPTESTLDPRPTAPEPEADLPPRTGGPVRIASLGVDGRLLSVHGDQAEVDVRGKRLRVAIKDVRGLARDDRPSSPGAVTVQAQTTDGLLPDLNVIGCTVVEACARVEQYLDRALLHSQRDVRIIHGHGTGRLRRSIASLLDDHPQVERFQAASPSEGGEGATIVVLKQ